MSINLIDFFDKGVAIDPGRACLVDGDLVRTYEQVQRASCQIAAALGASGIGPQSHAAVLSQNSARAFECVLGALRAGCAWVPVNARNALDETVHILALTGTNVLFYSTEFADLAAELRALCPGLKTTICLDGEGGDGAACLDALLVGVPDTLFSVHVPADAIATLSATGGTTGKPKAVTATHRVWSHRIAELMLRVRTPHPINLVAAPMTHAAGAGALEMMVMGATHVILPRFDPALIVDAIGRHRVTHMFLPPTAIYRLLAYPGVRGGDYSSLRYFNYASAPMSLTRLKEALSVFGPVMGQGYGSAEMGTSVCWLSPEAHAEALASGDDTRLGSCGQPSPVAVVAIANDDGNFLPPGQSGEIWVRSLSNAAGYYNDEAESERAFGGDWFRSGDVGMKDADGWVYVTDRKKDMIKSGGFNVYPSEIEQVLTRHDAVQDCAVVGVPDPDWGEAVKAVIELKAGMIATDEELRQLCREGLGGYKIPKTFEFWPELPRSPVGKVLKREIRATYWADTGKNI